MKSNEVSTFTAMIRILGIAVLFACTSMVWGQTTQNPFDLKYRPARPTGSSPDTPREVIIDSSSSIQMPKNQINSSSGAVRVVIEATPNAADSISRDTISDRSKTNPFEVNDKEESSLSKVISPSDTATTKLAVKKDLLPGLKKNASKGFQIFFLLLSLLFLIFIVNVERSFVRDLWRVISNENYSSLHHRNQRNTMRQIMLMMGYTVFIIQAGLFIYHAIRLYGPSDSLFSNFWISVGFVLSIYLTRHAMIRYLRWLFNNDKDLTLFGFDISIFNTMVGLILLPINILIIFGPESIYKPLIIIGVVTIIAAYLLRQLRWMFTVRQLIANSLFLFFVYLCAVEILPLWAISKLFW